MLIVFFLCLSLLNKAKAKAFSVQDDISLRADPDGQPWKWKGDQFEGVTLQQCADMAFHKGARCAAYAASGRCNYYVTATCSQVCNRSRYSSLTIMTDK